MNESPHRAPQHTQYRTVRSRANGAIYLLRIWCPPAAAAATATAAGRRLPVVYVLDGQDFFCTIVEAIARASRRPDATAVHPAIVVGIARAEGEEASEGGRTDGRHKDFTAGPPAEEPAGERRVGGAESFISFLETELMPSIEHEFPADPARRVLFGHSLAGYFALHVLATHPRLFETYVAVSPSIWWDEAGLRSGIERLGARSSPVPSPVSSSPVPSPRVFVAVGEWEGELPPWQRGSAAAERIIERRARRGMIDRARRFAEDLSHVIGRENVAFQLFPDEDHASVVLVAIARALRFALEGTESSNVMVKSG